MTARRQVGTTLAHVVVRAALRLRALQGDPGAALLTSPARRDPYPAYRDIRERGSLIPSSIGLLSASHATVTAVLRDHGFSSQPPTNTAKGWLDRLIGAALLDPNTALEHVTRAPNPLGPESLIGMDPPDHTRIRRLVSRAFTPRAIARWRPRVVQLTERLLDSRTRDGHFDVVADYAAVLPIQVICELLGIPSEDHAQFQRWGDGVALTLDVMGPSEQRRAVTAIEGLDAYFQRFFDERRRQPGEAVVDTLLAAEGGGQALTPRELTATTLLLLVAGFETTVNLIGNAVALLVDHPDQQRLLSEDRTLLRNAVDEVLRFDSPVQQDARFATTDLIVAGHEVPAGASVQLLLGGANRDPAVFDDPDHFDVTRTNARNHLAFAAGVHYCLGAELARLEGEIALSALLDRFDVFRLAAPPRRRPGLVLRGFDSLLLEAAPGRSAAGGARSRASAG